MALLASLLALNVPTALGASRGPTAAPMGVAALSMTFVVNSTADTADAANGNGVCADSLGRCTLRAAISEANSLSGDDRIEFALTGTAPVTIQLTSRLPNISSTTGSVTIDGYSQPGSAVNTATVGSNAIMGVEIRGNGKAAREMAFNVTSPNNTIRGLLMNRIWRGVWLDGAGAHHNQVIGNWIGYNKNGTSAPKANIGVLLNAGAHHNIIGTPALADRNVIGNFTHAEESNGPGTDFNVTQNNVLCIRPGGFGLATCATAIDHNFGPKHNLIGGHGLNEKNIIGPTTLEGIELSHGFDPSTHEYNATYQISENQVIGNWVGFRADGSYHPLFLSGLNASVSDLTGINIYDGSNDNLIEGNYVASVYNGIQVGLFSPQVVGNTIRDNIIGVSPLGESAPLSGWGVISRGNVHHNTIEGNTIRNAARGGVGLTNTDNTGNGQIPARNTRISQNIITDTNGPAIDLFGVAGAGGAGPDPNDPGDSDTGANTRLNTPVFTVVNAAGASGTAYAGSTVELFRASRPIGEFGLPTAYLGSAIVAANGKWTIPVALALGDVVTALQIRPDLNTSELAANVAATDNQAPVFSTDLADSTDAEGTDVSLDADATDPESDELTYSATGLPAGVSINSSTGVISGTLTFASAGVHDVVVVVSDGSLFDTDPFTWTVTESSLLVNDRFSRTVTNGWGGTSVGGPYALQGSAANYDVNGGVGTMALNSAGVLRSAVLAGVSATDVDLSFRVATNKNAVGGAQFIYGIGRRINANTEYRAKMRLAVNGNVYVQATSVVGNVETAIGAEVQVAGLSYSPGSFIWLRAQFTGTSPTTIRIRAWADGSAEPGTWQYTATNSVAALQAPGAVGLRGYLSGSATNAPVILSFDDFWATDIAP